MITYDNIYYMCVAVHMQMHRFPAKMHLFYKYALKACGYRTGDDHRQAESWFLVALGGAEADAHARPRKLRSPV